MGQRGALQVWDVAKVAFPYADRPIVRRRSAPVIAVPDVHKRYSVLWVLMITSGERTAWPDDVAIADLSRAGLSVPCYVRTKKVATVDARFAKVSGRLDLEDRRKVVSRLRGLPGPVLYM